MMGGGVMMTRASLGLSVCAVLLASACAVERGDSVAALEAAPAFTEATMDPQTGQVVGSRDGHGEHGYEAPPLDSLGGAFRLVEATKGQAFTDHDLKGVWALVYFGYMECLEACPIALKSLPVAVGQLNAADIPTKAVFVDINAPRLDDMSGGVSHGGGHAGEHVGEQRAAIPGSTHARGGAAMTGPDVRRQAIAQWGPQIAPDMIFLSGTRKELVVAVKAFQSRVEAAMLKNAEPIHHINHTTNIYILNPAGRVAGLVYHSDSVKVMSDTVKALAKAHPVAAPVARVELVHKTHE